MDFCKYLPMELVEEIFCYLSARDLAKCSEVSMKWREASNNRNLWRSICEESSLRDPWELSDVESSFEDPSYRFRLPPLSDRLVPITKWKIYYCQQKFIAYNWHQGRYAKQLLIKDNYRSICYLSFPKKQHKQCALVIPIVKQNDNHYEVNVMRIDGKPKIVYRHKFLLSGNTKTILAKGNMITYRFQKELKTFIYQNNESNLVRQYDLGPENKVNINVSKNIGRYNNNVDYFIDMTSSYLVAACGAYFHVWNRKTGDKLGFVNCPMHTLEMDSFCLQGDCIYFKTYVGVNHIELYEYNILQKTLNLIDTIYGQSACKILSTELYLILFTSTDGVYTTLSFYNRSSKQKVNEVTYSSETKFMLKKNNLFFFLNGVQLEIMRVPSWTMETKFKLPYSNWDISEIHNVGQNLLIISVPKKDLQVWDWEQGVLCFSLNCPGRLIWYDPIRLVVKRWVEQTDESEFIVIGFW